VLACLKKKASDRPATARELCIRLSECAVETGWTKDDATSWWEGRMKVDFGVSSSVDAEAAANSLA
jgi:hypothetical protein